MRRLLFFVITMGIFFSACHITKKIQTTPTQAPPKSLKRENKENKYSLMSKLKANNLTFKWISAHFDVDIDNDTSHESFGGVVRIRRDSIIWMTVSVLLGAVTAVHAKMTDDSVVFINHIDKYYFKGNYDYIDTLLNEDIDYDLIQSVMIGTSLEYYNDTAKMNAYFDGKDYLLSTLRKRRTRRFAYRNKDLHTKNDAQTIWMDSADFHIKKVKLEDFVTHHTFEATYEDFQKTESGISFPRHIHYEINTGRKIIKIDLKYKKINFSDSESIPFKIPDSYEQVHF